LACPIVPKNCKIPLITCPIVANACNIGSNEKKFAKLLKFGKLEEVILAKLKN